MSILEYSDDAPVMDDPDEDLDEDDGNGEWCGVISHVKVDPSLGLMTRALLTTVSQSVVVLSVVFLLTH